MKVRHVLACTAAVVALAGCNKNKSDGQAVAPDDTVTITQANPPPGGSWADVVNATSAGGVMMGNPNAKVKLVEIGSLSCPHCKAFEDEGAPTLVDQYVKTGKVSWEFRPYLIHGPIDMAADLIVRCNGIKSFFPLTKALYTDQAIWMGKLEAAPPAKVSEIQNLPTKQAFVAMANLLGLQDWAAARGVPQAKSNQCLTNQKMIDQEVQIVSDVQSQFPDFTGTPAFVINGKMLPGVAGWGGLHPQLDAAVKG
jgi:protein-disulfide isomerase